MNNFPLAGNLTSAFSHLALAGVAAILVDAADQGRLGDALARTWWSDESESQPMLATSLSEGDIGDAVSYTHLDVYKRQVMVRVHARPAASSTTWTPRPDWHTTCAGHWATLVNPA